MSSLTLNVTLALTLLSAGQAIAQQAAVPNAQMQEIVETKFTVAGKRSVLRDFYAVQSNCEPVDWTEVSIIAPAGHGTAEVASRETTMFYVDPNPRKACNGKSVQAKVITYRPDADFEGKDSIVVETINSEGYAARLRFDIVVRRLRV